MDSSVMAFDHEIDPDGDMRLILENPDAEFALWLQQPKEDTQSGSHGENAIELDRLSVDDTIDFSHYPEEQLHNLTVSESEEPVETATFRISSRHWKLASARFRQRRSDAWTPTVGYDGLSCETVENWSIEAILDVLNIIHLSNKKVPRTVTLERLASIAVIVDYLEAHEAIEPFSDVWMAGLPKSWPESYGRDLILRIWVSYVFGDEKNLEILKSIAIVYGTGDFDDLGLPIPKVISGKSFRSLGRHRRHCNTDSDEIQHKKRDAKDYIFKELVALRTRLEQGQEGCTWDCKCGLIGAMWMQLRGYAVFMDREDDWANDSLAAICLVLLKTPPYGERSPIDYGGYNRDKKPGRLCHDLSGYTEKIVKNLEERLGRKISRDGSRLTYAKLV